MPRRRQAGARFFRCEVVFHPRQKEVLGFAIFKLSELLARLTRDGSKRWEAPRRLNFHGLYVGMRGRGEVIVDFAAQPIGAGVLTVAARGCVHHYTPHTASIPTCPSIASHPKVRFSQR